MLLCAGVASAQEPIEAIKVKPTHDFSTPSLWHKPIIIKSQEEATKHFDKDSLTVLETAIDWKKQYVLVFVWNGSGGDELQHKVLESFPEQISFAMKRGLTKDYRPHSHVYAMRSDVKWSVQDEK